MSQHALTEDQRDEVAKRYRRGETIAALAAAYGVSSAPIRTALRERGVRMRPASPPRGAGAGLFGRRSVYGRIT
jgi:hypothetical protein